MAFILFKPPSMPVPVKAGSGLSMFGIIIAIAWMTPTMQVEWHNNRAIMSLAM